jgi:hypothetical protein
MIVIDKNNNGTFTISLWDKIYPLYIDDDYDFNFNHELTHEELDVTYTDTSTHKERYSLFNYLSSTFANATSGFWTYKIEYHGDLVATGRMYLKTDLEPAIQYDGYNDTAIVYEK